MIKESSIPEINKKIRNKKGNNFKHGHGRNGKESKTYRSWQSMKERCSNIKNKQYRDYGGRGITVCDRWLKFENFLEDMGECPNKLTLDRKNNNGNYCKSNCRWATQKKQNRNKRNNIIVTFNNKNLLLIELAEKINIPYLVLWKRLYIYGWHIEKAITTPLKRGNK
jgi:hypothetical protein